MEIEFFLSDSFFSFNVNSQFLDWRLWCL